MEEELPAPRLDPLAEASAQLRRVAAEARSHLDELEAIYRSAPVGLCVIDRDLRFVRINERLAAMNGIPAEAHVGRTVREVVPQIADQAEPALRAVIESGEPVVGVEIVGETLAEPGVEHHWLESWYPVRDASGAVVGVNVVAEDVTAERRAEAERAASEARYRALVEAAPLVAWSSRTDGRIDLVNRRWAEYAGEPAEAFVGRHWGEVVHPDDQEKVVALREHAIATGEPIELEVRFRRGDGGYRWHLVRVVPVATAAGVFAWHGVAVDIEDRKHESTRLAHAVQELADANAEASAARVLAEQANAAKSAFLATMSHELRTPLNAVLGYVELLQLGIVGPLTGGQRGYLDRVTASALHLLGLINEVLDFTKVEAGKMTVRLGPMPVGVEVRDAISFIRPQAVAKRLIVDVDGAYASGLVAVGDAGRVRQILVNLLGNAVRFTNEGGRVVIRAGAVAGDAAVPPTLRGPGQWVRIDVKDTGIGIPAQRLESVFDPFVQVGHDAPAVYTRAHGGTGLGLTIARRLARLMGGDLTADSAVGEGSTFTLWLPAVSPDAEARPSRAVRIELGRMLTEQAPAIVAAVAERLRGDPEIPVAHDAAQVDLEDHMTTFLADLGQALTILDAPDGDRVHLLADGTALQRLLIERHGEQRRRLGWSERAVRREFALIADEVERAIAGQTRAADELPLAELTALVRAFLDESARLAVVAHGSAPGGEP